MDEIVITSTDKSGRIAVLTKDQFIEAGEVHTAKDQQIGWNDIKYLQGQINSHTWWISGIVGNSSETDPARMNRNIKGSGYQIPEMSLLVKDHKPWQEISNKPVPTRPVLSGNDCLNTHLSELVSEILEPITLRIGGSEICSTEEAAFQMTEIIGMIINDPDWKDTDVLKDLICDQKMEEVNLSDSQEVNKSTLECEDEYQMSMGGEVNDHGKPTLVGVENTETHNNSVTEQERLLSSPLSPTLMDRSDYFDPSLDASILDKRLVDLLGLLE